MRWSRGICWIACLLAMSFGGSAHASCDAMLPALEKPSKPRAITADDLIGLRDIGVPNALAVDSPFGISPDGGHVAFVISRADAAATYIVSLSLFWTLRRGLHRASLIEAASRSGRFSA